MNKLFIGKKEIEIIHDNLPFNLKVVKYKGEDDEFIVDSMIITDKPISNTVLPIGLKRRKLMK